MDSWPRRKRLERERAGVHASGGFGERRWVMAGYGWVATWTPATSAQWAYLCAAFLVAVVLLKRVGAKLLAGLLTRDGLVVNIQVVSLAKLKRIEVRIAAGGLDVRVRAKEVYVDRVKLIQALSGAFVGVFRGDPFSVPVRVSGLTVTLDKGDGDGASGPEPARAQPAKRNKLVASYYNSFLTRFAVFVACLFRVDVDNLSLGATKGDAKLEVGVSELCVRSHKRNPILSVGTFTARASLHLEGSGATDLVLCETRLEALSARASGLEVLDSGVVRYRELEVDLGSATASHTSQAEALRSLARMVEGQAAEGAGEREAPGGVAALATHAPRRVNLSATRVRVETLEDKESGPWYEFDLGGLSVALTHREAGGRSSLRDFRYTWQLLVKAEDLEAGAGHHGASPSAQVSCRGMKTITTCTKTGKLVQNVIINVESIKTRVKPLETEAVEVLAGQILEYRNLAVAGAQREVEATPSRTEDYLGMQVAINSAGFYFDSLGKETIVASLPHVSIKLQKKPEGIFSNVDCKDLCLSIAKEGKRFLNSKLHAVRNQDIVNLGKVRVSFELKRSGNGSFLDTEVGITGCEIQLTSQYLMLADIVNEYGHPLMAADGLNGLFGAANSGSCVVTNTRFECSDLALYFSPVGTKCDDGSGTAFEYSGKRDDGLLCRMDLLTCSSMQGDTSNIHVKKCTLCKAANLETLNDSSGVLLNLTAIEDLTLTLSRSSRLPDGFQDMVKVWCTKLKFESDYDSIIFVLELIGRASKDVAYICGVPLFAQRPLRNGPPRKPVFEIQTHRLDVIFKESRNDLRLSVRSLAVRDEKSLESKYVSLFLLDKEVVKLRGLSLGVLEEAGHPSEVSLAIRHVSARLPDKLEVGKLLQSYNSSFVDLEREVKKLLIEVVKVENRGEGNASEFKCNFAISLQEWDFEVEHSQFETWLSSHKSLLYECNLGAHLLKETSQASISVFDYFSPSKYEQKSETAEESGDSVLLYNKLIRSYMKASQAVSEKMRFYKNALRFNGKGASLRLELHKTMEGSLEIPAREGHEKCIVIRKEGKCLMLDLEATFGEVLAHVSSMVKPFAHIKILKILTRAQSSNSPVGVIGGPDNSCSIHGDICVQIEDLDGMYGVAMEPYFAHASRAFRRLAAPRDKRVGEDEVNVFDQLDESVLGHFHFSIKSTNLTLLAEKDLREEMEDGNCYHVAMREFEVSLAQNTLSVCCQDFTVGAEYKIHRGNPLRSSVQYESVPIFKSPNFHFSISLHWTPHDALLDASSGTLKTGPASRSGTIEVFINFTKGDMANSPVIFAGERQVKCLAHVICLLKDPPDAMRDSFKRRPYGSLRESDFEKFSQKLRGLEFTIKSDPLKIRFWDPLPNAESHVATLDVQDYELRMVFRYTDLKMRVANAKVRRVPKLMEIDITGSDLVFNLKESDASDDEESGDVMEKEEGGSTPIQDQIALLLGNTRGHDSFKNKESLVLRIQSMVVSQRKTESTLLEKTPFRVQIHKAKGLLNTFKRDALYTCIQTVTSGINDVLNEHKGDDGKFEAASARPKELVDVPVKEEEEGSDAGTVDQRDLLSILLEKDDRPLASAREIEKDAGKDMNLDFVIEAIQPQFNFESEGANGRFLLSAEKAVVNGYKDIENGVCLQQKSEIELESIQMHVCQLDVDPNAQVQWLSEEQLKSGSLVSTNESLLHSVFDPCSISLDLLQRGQHFEIDIDLSCLTLALDPREFQITSDVLSRIALSPFPKMSEKISLSLLGADMLDITRLNMFASPEEVEAFKTLNRTAFEGLEGVMYAQTISGRTVEDVMEKPGLRCPEAMYLKERLKESMKHALQEKRDLVKAVLEKERKAKAFSGSNHKQSKVSLKVNEVKWSFCKDRKVFMEATLHKLHFSRVRYEDFSGITRFQLGEVICVASIVDDKANVTTYEVLDMWKIKEYGSTPFLHIYMVANGENHGLSSFELCDISVHPIEISLAQKTASEIQKYFFNKSLSPEERHQLWSTVSSPAPKKMESSASRKSVNFTETETPPAPQRMDASTSGQSHKSSRSLDFSSHSMQAEDGSHNRSVSVGDMSIVSATEYLLEDEEDNEVRSMLDLLNEVFPLSPSEKALIRQDSMNKERGILLNKVRVNELGMKLSFESVVLNVRDMKVYLDTFNYFYYKGTWQDLLEKVKWNIIKSVVKNVAGFQLGKIKAFTSSLTPVKKAVATARRKSIFSWNRGESPPGSSGKDKTDEGNEEREKRKLLFGDKYIKK